ncbi:hypothetical protein GQR36_02975 [Enterococcus termitis]
MEIDYQTKIRQVQDEQDSIRQEIRSVEQQQEEFSLYNKRNNVFTQK